MNPEMPKVIISLTSFPARIGSVDLVIRSLLAQTVKPWKIILWLTHQEFPEGERSLPEYLLALTRGTNFEIDWSNENYRPYNKLVHALRKYPDCAIVTVDDDILYPPDLLERLSLAWHENPNAVNSLRAHIITSRSGRIAHYREWIMDAGLEGVSNDFFLTGVGGVLYPPGCLDTRATDMSLAHQITPKNDDIWFWAMAILKGTPIHSVAGGLRLRYLQGTQEDCLCDGNVLGGENDRALESLFAHFPELMTKLSLNHPPLLKKATYCHGTVCFVREGSRKSALRLSFPLFQMKYNKDFTQLTYYVLRIPVWRRKCSPLSPRSMLS